MQSVPSEPQRNGSHRDPFADGRTPTATEVDAWAKAQGWSRHDSTGGPPTYVDQNGVVRVKIKRGSLRAPGSSHPHVELRDETGRRVDPSGVPVSRRSRGNHTPIHWDW